MTDDSGSTVPLLVPVVVLALADYLFSSTLKVLFVTHDQEEAMTMSDRIAVMNHGQIVQIGTPRKLYTSPRTPFVASFFGETNLLSCVADTAGNGAVKVTLASGFRFPAASDVERAQLSRNPATFVSIRPEKISVLAADQHAEVMVEAVVHEVAFLGKFVRVCTVASGVEITSIIGNAPERVSKLAEGAAIRLGWSREDAKVLGVDVEPGDVQVAGSGREPHDLSVQLREAL